MQRSNPSSADEDGLHLGDSLCPACYGLGRSKVEKREVQGFRDIFVCTFACEECGLTKDEVQLQGQHAPQGVRLTLQVPQGCAATLGRQILKADTATVSIPELEFEIGAGAYVPFSGDITTVADCLMQACKNLNMNQAERRAADAETASKIDDFIEELEGYAEGQHAYSFVIEDHAGNSFISGADGGTANAESDPQLTVVHYSRTPAQDAQMGLAAPGEAEEEEQGEVEGQQVVEAASAPGRCILKVEGEAEVTAFLGSFAASQDSAEQQDAAQAPAGVQLPASCHACDAAAASGFFVAVHRPVPGFIRDCVIVSQRCVSCGAAAAEVRGTGGVSAQGSRIRLRVESAADLQRTVLQSSSASLAVPELELALSTGNGIGMATTVGQLIGSLAKQLGAGSQLATGPADTAEQSEWAGFAADLQAFAAVRRPWTLEVTDPLDSSLVGAVPGAETVQGQEDVSVVVQLYDRTTDEEQHFGLARGGGAAPIA
ncbi:hypothetical protein D9Q98_001138 [Chlorella vulgaris]|uniref:Zinc finger ZPR1-type domain-containing protein n=1 Tax=Chlorella vulgaris TaxID=3077 RepID=A0A9D4TZM1_CHLVU|nr:hypothetical protein D9Q98_001138 [Chlorella vulgaris]